MNNVALGWNYITEIITYSFDVFGNLIHILKGWLVVIKTVEFSFVRTKLKKLTRVL